MSAPAERAAGRQHPAGDRWFRRSWWLPSWSSLMALAVLAPVLRPGYVLSYDMVFTPRQPLVPDAFGGWGPRRPVLSRSTRSWVW